MSREFRIYALQRSGMHAIIHWLRQCINAAGRKTFFYNNLFHPHQWEGITPQESLRPENVGDQDVVVNIEDEPLLDAVQRVVAMEAETVLGDRPVTNILILRDIYNTMASRKKFIESRPHPEVIPLGTGKVFVQTWKEYARMTSGWAPRNLPQYQALGQVLNPLVLLSYNEFVTGPIAPKVFSDALGLPWTDEGLQHVPIQAGGSSFDMTNYDGRAREMDVLGRWKTVDPDWYKARLDDEAIALNRELFPGTGPDTA